MPEGARQCPILKKSTHAPGGDFPESPEISRFGKSSQREARRLNWIQSVAPIASQNVSLCLTAAHERSAQNLRCERREGFFQALAGRVGHECGQRNLKK